VKCLAILIALATAALFQPWQAAAQTWSPQQQEVWTVVQAQWQASMAKDAGSTVVQDLAPMAIVVHGNTAVVHYHYSQARTDREGKHLRCSLRPRPPHPQPVPSRPRAP
jgi:hypothetical protein